MNILNYSYAVKRDGRNGAKPGRNRDASGKIYKGTDGKTKLYATISRDGEFGKIRRVLFCEENGEYFFLADERGNKILPLHKDQKKQQTKLLFRIICEGFPHEKGERWFLGDFTDDTKTKIKLTFDE